MYLTKARNFHRPSQQELTATKKVLITKASKKLGTRLRLTSIPSNPIALPHDTLPRHPLQARTTQVYGGYRPRRPSKGSTLFPEGYIPSHHNQGIQQCRHKQAFPNLPPHCFWPQFTLEHIPTFPLCPDSIHYSLQIYYPSVL